MEGTGGLSVRPAGRGDWPALEALFGPSGACMGCWCCWWRLRRKDFEAAGAPGRKALLKDLVESGAEPGLLAFDAEVGRAVAWAALGPREAFPAILSSTKLKPQDGVEAWALPCFYVDPAQRGRGLMALLLEAAEARARERGAAVLEAYPRDEGAGGISAMSAFTGTLGLFLSRGYAEAYRKGGRPVVRKGL